MPAGSSTNVATRSENARGRSRFVRCIARAMTTWRPRRQAAAHGSPPGPKTGSSAPLTTRTGVHSLASRSTNRVAGELAQGLGAGLGPEPAGDDRGRQGAAVAEAEVAAVRDVQQPGREAVEAPGDPAERRPDDAGRLRRAARQHEPRDQVRAPIGDVDRDIAPERQADDHGTAGRHLGLDRRDDPVARRAHRERLPRPLAVPGQVHRDAPVAQRQPAQLRGPLVARQPRAVHEHDRRRIAWPDGGPGAGDRAGHRPRRRGARSPRGPPGCGWPGRACRGCSTRACARCAR